ncbi:Endonuclease-reverse transcriptase [Operophtera brumata]|uniref:Endonuclease-reverse transcriptase n=1 Tax=Operophtera brumata TaxID=104452 RepID=A0A0L7KX87_OPEBR|nr:Endonuclease-reverse transcriptase [Operophtera brumata]
MEEITKLFIKLQQDLDTQRKEIREMKQEITLSINSNTNVKFRSLEIKNKILEEKVEQQKKTNKKQKTKETIRNNMQIKCDLIIIESVRRLGRRNEKVRPVVVTFTTLGKKIEILRNKTTLEKTSDYVKEDLPVEILKKRRDLQERLKELREQGSKAVLKYDKIIILNNQYSNKRNQPDTGDSSSEDIKQPKQTKKRTVQPIKKNKVEISKFF